LKKALKHIDLPYNKCIYSTAKELERSYKLIENSYRFDLSKSEITEAIIERLKMYYITQGKIKAFLEKRYLAPAADYFVESVLFFLKLYLAASETKLEAHSERQINKTKNAIRPDISVWKGDKVIAIIECKTQLGWNRDNWEEQYKMRDKVLKNSFPKAKSFLLVMTGINWGGFGEHRLLGKKYFCLLSNIWPLEYKGEFQILTPIEDLFCQLR